MVEIGLKRINPNKGKELVLETSEDGCIICTSHTPNKDGYIRIYQGKDVVKRYEMLHRMSYKKYKGEIPNGYEIDHKCRNRKCCNPEHLQALTVKDHKIKTNVERYALRKEGIVFSITEGYRNVDIAKAFGVTSSTVSMTRKKLNAIH